MRKKKIEDLFNRCKVTELTIDKEKSYVVNIDVGSAPIEEISVIMDNVITTFTKKLNLQNCVYFVKRAGREPICIREVTEDDTEHIKQLYKQISKKK